MVLSPEVSVFNVYQCSSYTVLILGVQLMMLHGHSFLSDNTQAHYAVCVAV